MKNTFLTKFQKSCLPLLAVFIAFMSCQKTSLNNFSKDLALDASTIRLADSAASTRIQVYSDNNWTVSTKAGDDWISLSTTSGSGKGDFMANVTSNKGNVPRKTEIYISAGSKTDTIFIQQKGLTAQIKFTDKNLNAVSKGGPLKTELKINLPFDLLEQELRYETSGEEGWISDINYNDGFIHLQTQQSQLNGQRQATLKFSYLDILGVLTQDSILIVQNPKAEYDDAILKDFNYVKNSLGTGVVTENIYIEGIVIVDKNNPNIAKNPNNPNNKHEIDKTENTITVYIQSTDGTSGIRIRTKTGGDNIFNKNEKVQLWLKGTTLTKTSAPATATISDFPSVNIISKETNSSALVPRTKYMQDLNDNDIYTYITLKDVEISVPSGSYYNINHGYQWRIDTYPTNIRDINGNSMYLLTNDAVPYKRNGTRVPQGSGNISGVIVNEDHPRYGNIGKYAIRPMAQEEIALANDRNNGFSNILVEWSKFPITTPDIGTGTLTATGGNNITGIEDYNRLTGQVSGSAEDKGAVLNGAWYTNNWWNNTKNRGEAWLIGVSTAGINKQLSLQAEILSNVGGPRNFEVEWSTTNDMDSNTWNYIADYTAEDLVNWDNTLLTQVPGFKVVNIKLPLELLGKPQVYIRLKVKDKAAGSTSSNTGATLSTSVNSRMAHLSIKYNK
ncbi:DUF5689 domain-containing protein [Pseudopedobacter beijingensis]|uniref:DUF5689 domain-containing protein n=1 Tax=Pseudopedobacter beijingensis TaxID=1207056 RepID=A0ABW4ICF1_9SPHI